MDVDHFSVGWRTSVGFYHAGLAQSILHHQHVRQAQSRTRLQLLVGDFHGRGRHPGQRLEEETQGDFLNKRLRQKDDDRWLHLLLWKENSAHWGKKEAKCVTKDKDGHECLIYKER